MPIRHVRGSYREPTPWTLLQSQDIISWCGRRCQAEGGYAAWAVGVVDHPRRGMVRSAQRRAPGTGVIEFNNC
jgi:hypothetical protein